MLALSNSLPKLSGTQETWALKTCLLHLCYRTKKNTSCLECGHIWSGPKTGKTCKCPACNTYLTIEDTRKKKLSQRNFFCILDVREEHQVVRIFEIYRHHKAGEPSRGHAWEVIQQFIVPNIASKYVVARNRTQNWYQDSFGGDLEIRSTVNRWGGYENKYDVWVNKMYPKLKVLPIYAKHGFTQKIDGISPQATFRNILTDSIAETLIKAKQYGFLACRVGNKRNEVNKHWPSIKLVMRFKYKVDDEEVTDYLDYLDLLLYFKKDILSPKYICPLNMMESHNQLVAKKTEIDDRKRYTGWLINLGKKKSIIKNMSVAGMRAEYERIMAERTEKENRKRYTQRLTQLGKESDTLKNLSAVELKVQLDAIMADIEEEARQRRLEKQKQESAAHQANYEKAKKRFFGLMFSSEDLTIKVLETLEEFIAEAHAHKHCIFTNGYYKKPNSLIFSARVAGKPMETIEVDLKDMRVVQSRGLGNTASKYNRQIIDLINKNMPAIRKRLKPKKKIKEDMAA